MGNNPLVTFMGHLSHDTDLSHVYTNHSIRSTATTFLGRANFTPKQIMSVTGHHSLNSLAVYQKVSQNEKLAMGMAMNMYLQSNEQQRQEVQLPQCPVPIAPKPQQAALGVPPKDRNEAKRTEIINYEPEDPLLQEITLKKRIFRWRNLTRIIQLLWLSTTKHWEEVQMYQLLTIVR